MAEKKQTFETFFFHFSAGTNVARSVKRKWMKKNSSPLAVHFFYARAQRSDTQTNIQNEGRKRERERVGDFRSFPVICHSSLNNWIVIREQCRCAVLVLLLLLRRLYLLLLSFLLSALRRLVADEWPHSTPGRSKLEHEIVISRRLHGQPSNAIRFQRPTRWTLKHESASCKMDALLLRWTLTY